jgi:UDP-N-acetylmuramate dehydrogenase
MKSNDLENMNISQALKKQYLPINDTKINNKKKSYKLIFTIIIISIISIFIAFSIIKKNVNKEIKPTLSRKSMDNKIDEKNFLTKLKLILDEDEILLNEMMSKHTTFKLGGPAKYFIIPKSIDKIIKVIQLCNEYSIEYFILGNGSNLLVSDKGFNGLVINIHENNFSNFKVEKEDGKNYKVTVGGGMLMRTLAQKLCILSLSGLEDIIDIPGTIGGGIIMNASAGGKGLISDSLDKVKVITPEGKIIELSKSECKLKRRNSLLKKKKYLIIEAVFKLTKDDKLIIQKTMADHTAKRYSRQPMYFPSAGSFFVWNKKKNGSLFEKYKENNLVGYKIGDAMIYIHNIAFIVNLGNAKASDVFKICIHVQKVIKSKYNIKINPEVIFLGSFD